MVWRPYPSVNSCAIQKRVNGHRIGIDGRMISYEKASFLNSKLGPLNTKLTYPVQNLIDFIWKPKPPKSTNKVFIQPREFTGEDAKSKLSKLRHWIRNMAPDQPSYSRGEPKPSQMHVGTVITSLSEIGESPLWCRRLGQRAHNRIFWQLTC
jgi:Xaa-Pro aminopeptidase